MSQQQPSLEKTLQSILKGISTETGSGFLSALVENLSKTLGVSAAWVSEYTPGYDKMNSIVFYLDGQMIPDISLDTAGGPCEVVLKNGEIVYVADKISIHFPDDPDLVELGMVSYVGVPFKDAENKVMGHVAVMDRSPLLNEEFILAVMQIFATRAGVELRRVRAENQVVDRERQLTHLLDNTPDIIVELDERNNITKLNAEAVNSLKLKNKDGIGQSIEKFVAPKDFQQLATVLNKLHQSDTIQGKVWIPGFITIICSDKTSFPAEATVTFAIVDDPKRFAIILRNVKKQLETEAELYALRKETQLLKEELKAVVGKVEIIGNSSAMTRVLRDVKQVACTNASVLIHGETGTGKELFARLIHESSLRNDKHLIKVNCAAIPAGLIESELFGHEKGAFTGAVERRKGRFSLADGGTLFLDEVAELPLELQPKLLRVLQEGEFEPVGSSKTQKVDVRILAATNRNLQKLVDDKTFREDLYYRLNVFPLELPPLRERGDDITMLAEAFVEKYSRETGRRVEPFSLEQIRRLQQYPWKGNVRELQNIIERALITTTGTIINLEQALPVERQPTGEEHTADTDSNNATILTADQMKELERKNIQKALGVTKGRISGEMGAARLLEIPSSTLNSRIKALGIKV